MPLPFLSAPDKFEYVGLAVIVVVIIYVMYINNFWSTFKIPDMSPPLPPPQPPLNQRLVNAGWKLYTRPGCGWCTAQIKLLGSYPATVCGTPAPVACKDIKAFPHWRRGSGTSGVVETRDGMQDLAALEIMAR